MDLMTVGLVVLVCWVSLIVVVVAMCKAAARGDGRGVAESRARTPEPAGRRFDQPVLS